MSGFWTIYRRELAGLFLAPLAWVLLCLALALNGSFFVFYVKGVDVVGVGSDVGVALSLMLGGASPFWLAIVLLPPLLTMRMVSEEARSGLLEFLLTAPVSDLAVVLGKLAAATTVMALLWSSAFAYGLTVQALGATPDWPPVISAVCGATLASALFCAVGLTMSAVTSTPLLAAFLSFVVSAAMLALPFVDTLLALPAGHWIRVALGHANLMSQFQASFATGVLDTKHLVQYLAATGFFVFLATRILETRRWR